MKLDLKRSRIYVVLAALAFYLLFVFRTSFVVDGRRYFVLFEDAMISMRYARNFADGHGFAWNAGEPPIEGFTNFLWTLWMSLAHKIGMSESKISLFIMLSGLVHVTRGEAVLSEVGPGEHFGEMALIRSMPRSATVTAVEPSELIALRRADFFEILRKEHELAVKLLWQFLGVLADRLERTSADLSSARQELAAEDISDAIFPDTEEEPAPPAVSSPHPSAPLPASLPLPAPSAAPAPLATAAFTATPPDPPPPEPGSEG